MAPREPLVSASEPVDFVIEDWGLVDYVEAVERQLATVDLVASASERGAGDDDLADGDALSVGAAAESANRVATNGITQSNFGAGVTRNSLVREKLIFCSHPPLVSTGRGTKPGDVFGWTGALLETSRGGRATYHGPSQVVVYPILNLNIARVGFKARDIHGYMHALESAICEILLECGTHARAGSELERENEFELADSEQPSAADSPSLTGVWVNGKKIASVGIGVRKGITYHGLALNVEHDPNAFQGINPCGFTTDKMTSVEKEGVQVSREKIKASLSASLLKRFQKI